MSLRQRDLLLVITLAAMQVVDVPVAAELPPPLHMRWKIEEPVERWDVLDGVVYALCRGKVVAFDSTKAAAIWTWTIDSPDPGAAAGPLLAGGSLYVAFGEDVCKLDPRTGVLQRRAKMPLPVTRLAGPPLVAAMARSCTRHPGELCHYGQPIDEQVAQLVRLDEATLAVKVRGPEVAQLHELLMFDETIVAHESGKDLATHLSAYRALDLRRIWTTPVIQSDLWRVDRRLWLSPEGSTSAIRPVDVTTGSLGDSIVLDAESRWDSRLSWEFQYTSADDEPYRLRRNDAKTGAEMWSATLPGMAQPMQFDGSTLWAFVNEGGGVLATVDATDGRVRRRVQAPCGMVRLTSVADVLVTERLGIGLVGYSMPATDAKAAEESTKEAVERIFSDLGPFWFPPDYCGMVMGCSNRMFDRIGDALRELQSLGPEALPLISAQLPRLEEATDLVAAAAVIQLAAYREAAPALAQRLREPIVLPRDWPAPDRFAPDLDPTMAILAALAKVGGPAQVPAVVAVAKDPSRRQMVTEEANKTLQAIDPARKEQRGPYEPR